MNYNIKVLIKTALFTSLIVIMTTFFLHIPTGLNGGYIHLGDVFIFLAAVFLPKRYAIMAAIIGGGLSDFLSGAVVWVIPTMIIKPFLVLAFTNKSEKILCRRNIIASILAIFITYIGYSIANGIFVGNIFLGFSAASLDIVQGVSSSIIFIIIGSILDKIGVFNKVVSE